MGAIGLGIELAPGMRARAVPVFDFSAGVLPSRATLTRASLGTRYDSGGVLSSEAPDVPRFDHDPATGAPRGLLIEEQRTNLAPRARYDPGNWALAGGIVLAGSTVNGIDGVATPRFRIANAASQQIGATLPAALPATTTMTMSWFARSATMISLGTCGYYDSGSTIASAAPPLVADGGWHRAQITLTTSAVVVALPTLRIHGYSGAAVDDVLGIDFLQIESGSTASSPIPTSGAPATRAADVLTLDWRSFGVADGAHVVRYHFDDGSSQDAPVTLSGGTMTVQSLARPWLSRAELI